MELWTLILCVIPTIVTPITISPNGNSPEIKMIGGMMVDVQKGFSPMVPKTVEPTKTTIGKRKLSTNSTKLSINERYRRLIPYMTFYYANDLVTPTTEGHAKNVEVEKAEIIEAKTIEHRQPKKIVYSSNRNIPLYQGNRLTQYNIASANPTKLLYKEIPVYQNPPKNTQNYNPLLSEHRLVTANENFEFDRFPQKQIVKSPSAPFSLPTRRPYTSSFNNNDDSGNIRYYYTEKEHTPKYKLVPYEQTPPVKVHPHNEQHVYTPPKSPTPVPVMLPKEQVYIKPRPVRPQYFYDVQQSTAPRKQPSIVSESYYERRPPQAPVAQPIIESGFKPIVSHVITTEVPVYTSSLPEESIRHFESEKQQTVQVVEAPPAVPDVSDYKQNYYQYVVDQPTYKPQEHVPPNTVTLSDLLNSLQLNKSIPKPITKENVGASIRTLIQVLNALRAAAPQEDFDDIVQSTPKPFIPPNKVLELTKPIVDVTPAPVVNDDADFHEESYLAPVNPPSQHIDEFSSTGSTSQRFPLRVESDDEGGTPGRPGVDYPILTTIPQTAFDCKTQRYKGFFADPETRCQVWHYCDLNGGQASFLCPNGTIFSQAALTCDWWFNVRCASTTQLYVLNESLYKYILPHSPKFPEDYSGPLVDKYLTLKFKEMEEQFRKNKNKQSASDKMDSGEESSSEDSSEAETESSSEAAVDVAKTVAVSEASVIVQSPGASGNVERLQD
ncbi:titin [Ostrinia nubilalis]|uniref:titin n=1 Tax=Ostrinia nubilalis TaxID=29057 RepID=UPI0030825ADA